LDRNEDLAMATSAFFSVSWNSVHDTPETRRYRYEKEAPEPMNFGYRIELAMVFVMTGGLVG
jgi:hypothetical protein